MLGNNPLMESMNKQSKGTRLSKGNNQLNPPPTLFPEVFHVGVPQDFHSGGANR